MDNEIFNFYNLKDVKKHMKKTHNPHFEKTQIKLPSRIAFIGATGAGKTTILMDYLRRTPKTFNKIIVVHKMEEPLYDFMAEKLEDTVIFYKDLKELSRFNELRDELQLEETDQILMIFDDQVDVKDQSIIKEYMLLGRKVLGGISIFYLSQSYFTIPYFIRQQLSHLILIKIKDKHDLQRILSASSLNIEMSQLIHMYKEATKMQPSFLKISLGENNKNKIFSKNWIEFFEFPESDIED